MKMKTSNPNGRIAAGSNSTQHKANSKEHELAPDQEADNSADCLTHAASSP